ncbi:hypothetical protein B296_00049118 [Ensete ventricosum]|uniref:Uncharacterized protein n=1 Tax=Ensete ventricosum TaxID=4639 RepID=A0A426WYF3_ENSVE|nr:hypothetical protein B296_00049118 [Ensete ventricosum]
MYPLRFPNSGNRAKVFVRKIGFKLCDEIISRRIVLPKAPSTGRLAPIRASPKGRPVAPTRGSAYGQKRRPQGAASRGQHYRQQGRLPTGKGSRHLRRGSISDDDAEGERGDPRCRGGRLRRMVMRRSDGTDDDEINNHMAWRCADAHIDPIVSD